MRQREGPGPWIPADRCETVPVTTDSGAPEPSAYVGRLPIGERLTLPEDSLTAWDVFPFEDDVRVKALEAPVLPEPEREGERGPEDCGVCGRPLEDALWADEHWRLDPVGTESRLPAVVMLWPREHGDLSGLPAERAAELGVLIQRIERAVGSLDGIGRVHINRWGDGSAHFHLWFIARPAGMLQLRGALLPVWDELLPPVPEEERRETHRRIAAALAAEGGTAYAT